MNGSQYQEAELAMNANSYTVESGIATKYVIFFLISIVHSLVLSNPPFQSSVVTPLIILVSRGQTLFRTEGKGLGFGHRATCRPAPWSAYQSQHTIQSHDT